MAVPPVVRILLIDDDPDILDALSQSFADLEVDVDGARFSVEVSAAVSGVEALEHIEADWFDAVVVKVEIPKMTGLEFLAALRGAGHDNPVVVLAGASDGRKSAEALRLGSYAFIKTPYAVEKLRKTIVQAARHGMALRERAQHIEDRLKKIDVNHKPRRAQLRTILRSIEIGSDGRHRPDVCAIPNVREPKRKLSRGS